MWGRLGTAAAVLIACNAVDSSSQGGRDVKTLLLASLLLSSSALADTVTLFPSGCANTRTCVAVANDQDADIAIYDQPSTPSGANTAVYVIFDGVQFYSPFGNGSTIADLSLFDEDGRQIVLNATFSGNRHYVGGRGGHWVTTWTLTGGSIERIWI